MRSVLDTAVERIEVADVSDNAWLLPQVMICHPGRQHSHQLAIALAEAEMLSKYIVGVPTHCDAIPFWLQPLVGRALRRYAIDIDPQKIVHNFSYAAMRRVAKVHFGNNGLIDWGLLGNKLFDRAAARWVAAVRPNIVVGYERGALETFRAAKRLNILTVLDAASFHHTWQDRFYEFIESPRAHSRLVARKNAEIEIADHILTVSEFARESYVEAGVPAERVHAIPMGTDLQRFSMREREAVRNPDTLTRFVFVGHIDRRKGADVLRAAANCLYKREVQFCLSIIGGRTSSIHFDNLPYATYLGRIPQNQLPDCLRQHDVLVLPSRHDSFGMVVAEAMACGLPVIVTDHVGAKEMVIPGENGFIVPAGDVESLEQTMDWFVRNRSRLPAMSKVARLAAERYDWTSYRARAVQFFAKLVTRN